MGMRQWLILVVVVILVVIGLRLLRRPAPSTPTPTPETTTEEVKDRVNRLLESAGIEVPAGVKRVDLVGSDSQSTGVATVKADGQAEITILAAVPDLDTGWYEGWLTKSDGSEPLSLGRLTLAKGGYLLETTITEIGDRRQIIVSSQVKPSDQPTTEILKGTFE